MLIDLAVESQRSPDRGFTLGAHRQSYDFLLNSLVHPGVDRLGMNQVATVHKLDKPCVFLVLWTEEHLKIWII